MSRAGLSNSIIRGFITRMSDLTDISYEASTELTRPYEDNLENSAVSDNGDRPNLEDSSR